MKPTLASGAAALLNLHLTTAQLEAFQVFADVLAEWNTRINLTRITDPHEVMIKHFLDSLSVLLALGPDAPHAAFSLIDIGAGAGFPGLPLKLVCPDMRLTLVEATGKKEAFLEHLVEQLDLGGVTTLKSRAEEVGQDPAHRAQYDWAVARAVAELPVLVEYLLPLVRLGGRCVAQKGSSASGEAQGAEYALRLLGGRLEQVIPVQLPTLDETRYLVVIEKVAPTPDKYPRRPGQPAKAPLR